MTAVNSEFSSGVSRKNINIGLAAFGAAAAFTLLSWLQKSPFDAPLLLRSTDDMARMVMVRDLLAGQGWFDLMQRRLGIEPGTLMHWSRLIDAPIAALVRIGSTLGIGDGERFAAIAWPFLNFVAAFAALLTAVRRASLSSNVLPAFVIGGFALAGSGVFESGVIDHHNVQLALTLWLIAMLMPSRTPNRDFAVAGVIMSVMLAIGMESLPTVVAGAAAIVLRLVMEGEKLAEPVRRFGLALTLSIAGLYLALTGPQNYAAAYCDAFSAFQLVCAGVGGLLLYGLLHPLVCGRLPAPLVTAPLIAGAGVLALALIFFPQCLSDPGSAIDPVLRKFWFDQVTETQSAFQIARLDPWLLPYIYVLPILAAIASVWMLAKRESRSIFATLLIFIAVTTAVTLLQMRGTQYATPVAALALAIIVTRFGEDHGEKRQLALLGAMLASCILVWKFIITGAIAVFSHGETGPLIASGGAEQPKLCESPASIASLNAESSGLVAGSNNLGPLFLLTTGHRVLTGPYHRNVEGNLAWINSMIGTPEQARSILKSAKVTLLAICPTDPDEASFMDAAPKGFLQQLVSGKTFDWLQPVEGTADNPLRLWRFAG